MKAKNLICPQCGGVIPPGAARCPFCGSAEAQGAEREYMEKLERVKSELGQVGEVGEIETRREARRVGKKIALIVGIVFLIAAVAVVIGFLTNKKEEEENRKEYSWRMEALPELEALFESGEYDTLAEKYENAIEEGHYLYDWKHKDFCELYRAIWYVDACRESREKGIFTEDDAESLLFDELSFRGMNERKEMPAQDRKILKELLSPYENDLSEIFGMSEEDVRKMDEMLQKYNGYPSYEECEKYVKAHPEILTEPPV